MSTTDKLARLAELKQAIRILSAREEDELVEIAETALREKSELAEVLASRLIKWKKQEEQVAALEAERAGLQAQVDHLNEECNSYCESSKLEHAIKQDLRNQLAIAEQDREQLRQALQRATEERERIRVSEETPTGWRRQRLTRWEDRALTAEARVAQLEAALKGGSAAPKEQEWMASLSDALEAERERPSQPVVGHGVVGVDSSDANQQERK